MHMSLSGASREMGRQGEKEEARAADNPKLEQDDIRTNGLQVNSGQISQSVTLNTAFGVLPKRLVEDSVLNVSSMEIYRKWIIDGRSRSMQVFCYQIVYLSIFNCGPMTIYQMAS